MKYIIAVLFAVAILLSLISGHTNVSAAENYSAAKCAMPSLQAAYSNSKAVFSGKVLSERKEGDEKIFTIKVERTWKGPKSKMLEVRYFENMRYQSWMKVGEKYLVYAYAAENGMLADGRCSQTKPYSSAKEDLKRLGKGKAVK